MERRVFDFRGKNALVTGAASGIGLATAQYFHACGANVVLADIDQAGLDRALAGMDLSGRKSGSVVYNASQPETADGVVEYATGLYGKIDFVVACAGINEHQLIDGMTDEQWHRMISINLDGVFYITRRAISQMNDGGAIVTLASHSAHKGGSYAHAHYGATKGGILAYTRGLARDIAPRLRANCLSPGLIATPMLEDHMRGTGLTTEQLTRDIPLARLGTASEVASVAAFLCSDAASYITGESILITGGVYMG